MLKRSFMTALLASTFAGPLFAQGFDGPTAGPKAAEGKTIVVLAADLKNGGILGVTTGVEEAAAKIGWTVRVLDGAGSVQGRTAAFGQAMALQPDGIVINGFDAVEQQAAMEGVAAARIPMVSWHSGPKIGCDAPGGIFANVSTDAMQVSDVAAKWALDDAGGKPGVIIFTDSTYQIAIDKADRMKKDIEEAGGTVLEYVDTPIAETSTRMGPLTTSRCCRSMATSGPIRWPSTTCISTSWARPWPLLVWTARPTPRRVRRVMGRKPRSSVFGRGSIRR